jgi:uncharacterized membrane protein
LALSTELPLITLLPRAWIGFGKVPWRCVGLAALILISAIGPAVVAQDLRMVSAPWLARLGDIAVLISLGLPMIPLLVFLRLADQLLPDTLEARLPQRLSNLLSQSLVLVVFELLLLIAGLGLIQFLSWAVGDFSTILEGIIVFLSALILGAGLFTQVLSLPLLVYHRCKALQAMDHSRRLVQNNRLKMLAVLGLLLGINALGLLGATLGLLLSLPFSALVLMACCRPQTPWRRDSRRNILPT